jgi:hypothetical protein
VGGAFGALEIGNYISINDKTFKTYNFKKSTTWFPKIDAPNAPFQNEITTNTLYGVIFILILM